ncbi:MAG: HD domain-containing protein [Myxococcota bacterium]
MTPDEYHHVLTFAARAHGEQRTPHGLPYLTHLCMVAREVEEALAHRPDLDRDLAVRCALLHDVVEDTPVSPDEVAATFGAAVAAGVLALTKDRGLPKPERMPDSLRRIRAQPSEVAAVKMADRIVNLGPPPPHWSLERQEAYRAEAQTLLDALGFADETLAARLSDRIAAYPP